MKDLDHLDLETLITLAERLAKQTQDGHLTILRFTTEWKCALGTPSFYSSDGRGLRSLTCLGLRRYAKH